MSKAWTLAFAGRTTNSSPGRVQRDELAKSLYYTVALP